MIFWMRWFLIDVVGWLNGVCYRNGFQYSPWESVAAHSIFVRSSIFFGQIHIALIEENREVEQTVTRNVTTKKIKQTVSDM